MDTHRVGKWVCCGGFHTENRPSLAGATVHMWSNSAVFGVAGLSLGLVKLRLADYPHYVISGSASARNFESPLIYFWQTAQMNLGGEKDFGGLGR